MGKYLVYFTFYEQMRLYEKWQCCPCLAEAMNTSLQVKVCVSNYHILDMIAGVTSTQRDKLQVETVSSL